MLIHRAEEKKERELWSQQETPEDLNSLLNQSSVDGAKSSVIVVKRGKLSYQVSLPFKLLTERLEAQGYSLCQNQDILEYLNKVGKSLYLKKGFKESLSHLLASPEGDAIVSRLYAGSWEAEAEKPKAIQ